MDTTIIASRIGAAAKPIRRLLIANRGEIACRIISSCRKLGITSIAVYLVEDRESLHVSQADEALCIGSIRQSKINPHVNIETLIKAATDSKADGIHPGYGYLSENADFSRRVTEVGLVFVGPGPDAIAKLGDKRHAKDYLAEHAAEIPLIPGYSGKEQDSKALRKQAELIGFPVLIKAAAGGGGKGMRVVHNSEAFAGELQQAQSEGLRSFGSSDCLLEKYVERGKHVEIQMLGDSHGNVVTLFDRECSIQRRHQKIIEEAPCLWLSDNLRSSMSEAAKTLGRLLSYENAGTVEYIVDVDKQKYYFLEVNTRIQVEHAITEETTGTDLVALQLYVASGGNLNDIPALEDLRQSGHAIECRLCAEDPHQNFMPGSGTILNWGHGSLSDGISRVRIETAVQSGSQISVHFDPMIAKIVVWAPSRGLAKARMLKVMSELRCVGLRTNQLFLQACLAHSAFDDVAYSTGFIPANLADLLRNPYIADETQFAIFPSLCANIIAAKNTTHFRSVSKGFRNQRNGVLPSDIDMVVSAKNKDVATVQWNHANSTGREFILTILSEAKPDSNNEVAKTKIQQKLSKLKQGLNGTTSGLSVESFNVLAPTIVGEKSWKNCIVTVELLQRRMSAYITIGDAGTSQTIYCHFPQLGTFVEYQRYSLLDYCETLRDAIDPAIKNSSKIYKSQMPCKVIRLAKKAKDTVKSGEVLLVVESMKMEVSIVATADGIFKPLIAENDAVDADVVLCELI